MCVKCEQCVNAIRQAIQAQTQMQIKNADIAQLFVESAMTELLNFLLRREEHCKQEEPHEHDDGT